MAKQSNNSTKSFKGIIYQFLVALEKCFELQENETVYIETFGDVSVFGEDSVQIESKFYNNYLTDTDHNVWNTLNNWMKEEFPLDRFSSLVLFTTQKVRYNSPWYDWNRKTKLEKYSELIKIRDKFLKQRKQSEKTKLFLDSIFEDSNKIKLLNLLDKLVIDHNAIDDENYYKKIKEKYAKSVSSCRADSYIRAMFGYILSPKIISNNWEISYENFSQELQNVTQQLVETTTVFPSKIQLDNIKYEDYQENLFIEKIKNIEYHTVLTDAITDFVQTRELIMQEFFLSPSIHKSLKGYEENLERTHQTKYRKACRNCSDEKRIHSSQDFYDDIMGASGGSFHTFNMVPPYFYNGIYHMLADEKEEIVWLLK